MSEPFQYATIRVVPSVERAECINAAVVVFARTRAYLGMRVHLDRDRLAALWPGADADDLAERLDGLARIAMGDPEAGPIAALPVHERFHWLVAPASTVLQPGEVHTGMCADPAGMLEHLFERVVAPPR